MSATREASLLAELERLRERAAARDAAPGEVEAEKRDALAAVEVAKGELRDYYARLEPGAKPDRARERALADVIRQAEDAAAIRWDDRLEGARLAVLQARQELLGFVQGNWDALAAERLPLSVGARDKLAQGLEAFEAGLNAWEAEWGWWHGLVAHVGISAAELPANRVASLWQALGQTFPGDVPAPVPSQLAPLLGAVDHHQED